MSKHTPGPWKASQDTEDGFVILTTFRASATVRVRVIAECWPCVIVDDVHRMELSANAALIAAAPELAECLRDVAEGLRTIQSGMYDRELKRAAALLERLGM